MVAAAAKTVYFSKMKTARSTSLLVLLSTLALACATLRPETVPLTGQPGALFTKPAADLSTTVFWASADFLSSRLNTSGLRAAGYDAWRQTVLPRLRDVQALKLSFNTHLLPGGPADRQSGLLLLPAANRLGPLPLKWVIWTRGTELVRASAPSNYGGYETLFPTLLASLGYGVWMPDYAGFGDSPGIQTYCVPDSAALSALDGLQAARKVVQSLPQFYSDEGVFSVCGYSQGGQSAAGTARLFSASPKPWPGLKLDQVFALGAPLDLMIGADGEFDLTTPLARPEYSLFLALGWARAYPEIDPATIINPVLLKAAKGLYDGELDNDAVHLALAKALGKPKGSITNADLLRPDYLQTLRDRPQELAYYRLQKAARLDRWIPPAGVRLHLAATMADKVVNPQNSLRALAWIKAADPQAQVDFTELKSADHVSAGGEAYLLALMRLTQ